VHKAEVDVHLVCLQVVDLPEVEDILPLQNLIPDNDRRCLMMLIGDLLLELLVLLHLDVS